MTSIKTIKITQTSKVEKQTFAVLNATLLQSGKMLTDHGGKEYDLPRNVTVAVLCSSMFARKAEHAL